jgi:ketoreductase RED2
MDFTNSVALVTGSRTGIGAAIAERLAREGTTVVLNSRHALASPVYRAGSASAAHHIACDVAREDSVAAMLAEIEAVYGRLDILVNCAGATVFVDHSNLAGVDSADWERIPAVNLIGPWNTVKCAEELLKASPLGSVINMSSMAGLRPAGSSIPYAVSKAGLNHLTALQARALGPAIRVNAIAPGFIETPWTSDYRGRRAEVQAAAPLRRVGQPEDVAELCLGLIRSEYVTGQVIPVDGGLSLL